MHGKRGAIERRTHTEHQYLDSARTPQTLKTAICTAVASTHTFQVRQTSNIDDLNHKIK
jgi:hypothetical protein